MSMKQPKKIVVTAEEVALTPTRKTTPRNVTKIPAATVVNPENIQTVSAHTQVMELDPQSLEEGVTFIQVNELGEVAAIDSSLLSQDIAIQITGDDSSANATPLDANTIAIAAAPENPEVTEVSEPPEPPPEDQDLDPQSYVIQPPDSYRREILEIIHTNLVKNSEKYADLAIFCSDGVAWTSKLILSSASPFVKDLLLDVPNLDDTCLVIPHMTKLEFITFQNALFSKDDTQPGDMYSVIKGCEMLCIDLEEQMTVLSNPGEEPPLVEYRTMLSNPFENKRVLKSLGYVPQDGFSESSNTNNSDIMKNIGSVLKVLDDNIKCNDCNRNFFDTSALERHQKLMHSSYSIGKLVR